MFCRWKRSLCGGCAYEPGNRMEYPIPDDQGETGDGLASMLSTRLLLQADPLTSDPGAWFWAQLDVTPYLLLRLVTLHRLLAVHRLLSVYSELEVRWRLAPNWSFTGSGLTWPKTELELFEDGFGLRTLVAHHDPHGLSAKVPETLSATYVWGSLDEFVDAHMPDPSLGPQDFLEPSLDRLESGIYEINQRAFAWRVKSWLHESGQPPLRDAPEDPFTGATVWPAN